MINRYILETRGTLAEEREEAETYLGRRWGHALGPWRRHGNQAVYLARCERCDCWAQMHRFGHTPTIVYWHPGGPCPAPKSADSITSDVRSSPTR